MAVAGRAESELNQGAAVTDDNPNVAKAAWAGTSAQEEVSGRQLPANYRWLGG